jgi:hypothetical protein
MDMSAPPPATNLSAPGPQPAEAFPPKLSEGARLIDTFIAPRKTFEDIRQNSSWWVPWLISAILSVAFGAIAAQRIDMVQFTRHQIEQSKMRQRQMEQLSPEQQERQIRFGATVTKVAFYVSPVFSLIGGLVIAAVLMAVFNFGFAAEVSFPQAMAIVFYSFLPRGVLALLLGVSLLVSGDPNSIDIAGNPMPTNPGFFMDPQGNKFLYSLASGLDIFALWIVILLGLGFAAASSNRKLQASTTITTMLVIYAVVTLAIAAVKAAF